MNCIIFSQKSIYEYNTTDVKTALDSYIREELGFNSNFSATEALWGDLKNALNTGAVTQIDYIDCINGLIKKDKFKIEKVVSNFTVNYEES